MVAAQPVHRHKVASARPSKREWSNRSLLPLFANGEPDRLQCEPRAPVVASGASDVPCPRFGEPSVVSRPLSASPAFLLWRATCLSGESPASDDPSAPRIRPCLRRAAASGGFAAVAVARSFGRRMPLTPSRTAHYSQGREEPLGALACTTASWWSCLCALRSSPGLAASDAA
ncbi:hypothetical protein PR202_ga14931 [Eleusine coracana subsp. coracana]|uniref:Uncharacterized protein n=1 Tax=Eleusine coracana subsp. coracana TaxID=191504 RepID=A0AAV5CIQ9_ELECO|nr:hypothetical protein PR202_ga14931 [Eleusine coracana subsp. coracana]